MPQKKGTLFLEVHNETRLLLFMLTRYVKVNKRQATELFIWNSPPDTPAFNNEHLQKVLPSGTHIWDISNGPQWVMRNKTRYKPLDWKRLTRKEDGREIIIVKILPTNNHISIEDINLLETMGETVETK